MVPVGEFASTGAKFEQAKNRAFLLFTCLESSHNASRYAGCDGSGWDVACDDAASGDHRVVAHRDALEDDRASADPHAILDRDRPHHQTSARKLVLISIHDDDLTGDLAVAANRDRLSRHDLR